MQGGTLALSESLRVALEAAEGEAERLKDESMIVTAVVLLLAASATPWGR